MNDDVKNLLIEAKKKLEYKERIQDQIIVGEAKDGVKEVVLTIWKDLIEQWENNSLSPTLEKKINYFFPNESGVEYFERMASDANFIDPVAKSELYRQIEYANSYNNRRIYSTDMIIFAIIGKKNNPLSRIIPVFRDEVKLMVGEDGINVYDAIEHEINFWLGQDVLVDEIKRVK